MSRGAKRRIAAMHTHALERLRERYSPGADRAHILEIRDLARANFEAWKARGRKPGRPWLIPLPFQDCCETEVAWRGLAVRLIYVPGCDAVRTVLPPLRPIRDSRLKREAPRREARLGPQGESGGAVRQSPNL